MTLEHGERYGQLTVLDKVKTSHGWRYRVGCVCGYSLGLESAKRLMSGRITSCRKCRTNGERATQSEVKEEV